MAKKRLYEIARELGLESREVLDRALELGLEVKTASSGLEEDDAALLSLSFQETETPASESEAEIVEVPSDEPAAVSPGESIEDVPAEPDAPVAEEPQVAVAPEPGEAEPATGRPLRTRICRCPAPLAGICEFHANPG